MHRNVLMAGLAGVLVSGIVLTLAVRSTTASQPGAGAQQVAAMNMMRVINEYDRYKDLRSELQTMETRLQDEVTQRRNRIDEMNTTLSTLDANDPTLERRTRELLQAQIEFKNWFDMTQAGRVREFGIWIRRIHSEVREMTQQIAEREGYSIVIANDRLELQGFEPEQLQQQIASQKTIYVAPQADITQLVLDELNKRYRQQAKEPMLQP